jgi:hypothetical protein
MKSCEDAADLELTTLRKNARVRERELRGGCVHGQPPQPLLGLLRQVLPRLYMNDSTN